MVAWQVLSMCIPALHGLFSGKNEAVLADFGDLWQEWKSWMRRDLETELGCSALNGVF